MKIERNKFADSIFEMHEKGFTYLVKITAVDYQKYLEMVYIFRNLESIEENTLEIDLDPSDLWMPSITNYYKAADWYERELQEMFGVEIKGRNAKRLLLEKWDGKGFPLRKNFEWNKQYETME